MFAVQKKPPARSLRGTPEGAVPPCFSPPVAGKGLMADQVIGCADNGACRPRFAPARRESSGAMFALPPSAGLHPPGSLNDFAQGYSFLHRLIYSHYSAVCLRCQVISCLIAAALRLSGGGGAARPQLVKKVLTSWWTRKHAPPPLPPSPVSAKNQRFFGRGACKETIFSLENGIFRRQNRPVPTVHAAGHD